MSTKSPLALSPITPNPLPDTPHHEGSPPTRFRNPWPSAAASPSVLGFVKTMLFGSGLLPLPPNDELVPVRTPDWGAGRPGLKATWFGHASFLVETTARDGAQRGVRIFFDPVFSERMSPVSFAGPKRIVSLPCALEQVPDVDLVVISHNHYDHLDHPAVMKLYERRGNGNIHFLCPLGLRKWFQSCGIAEGDVTELDWWHGSTIELENIGSVDLICTPSQHNSARTGADGGKTLWCSWVLRERAADGGESGKRLFFGGDTGYRSVSADNNDRSGPACPAFAEIGSTYGPFALALLPIGCFLPRDFLSTVHASPEDSIDIHRDIRSKQSVGMHYGTIRAGISGQHEDVREAPRRWKACCEAEGLVWGKDIRLCDIGETVVA